MNQHASARLRAAAALLVLSAVAAAWLGAHAANAARDAQTQSNSNTQPPQAGQHSACTSGRVQHSSVLSQSKAWDEWRSSHSSGVNASPHS